MKLYGIVHAWFVILSCIRILHVSFDILPSGIGIANALFGNTTDSTFFFIIPIGIGMLYVWCRILPGCIENFYAWFNKIYSCDAIEWVLFDILHSCSKIIHVSFDILVNCIKIVYVLLGVENLAFKRHSPNTLPTIVYGKAV